MGQGRGLGELADRLLSASLVVACCVGSDGEVAALLLELLQRHPHTVGVVHRL